MSPQNRLLPVLVGAALSFALAAPARAATCNYTVAQFNTDRDARANGFAANAAIGGVRWDVPNGIRLCPGTFEIPGGAIYLRAGRTLELGELAAGATANQQGLVTLRARNIRILGTVNGATGTQEGNQCGFNNARAGGGAGLSPVTGGGGSGGANWTAFNQAGGGGGGGGAGHGATGGAGGIGSNANARGGADGAAYGSATDGTSLLVGANGGGGACSSDANERGGNGGRGGAALVLDARDVDVPASGIVSVNGTVGSGPQYNAGFFGIQAGGGAGGGGGGGGGTVLVRGLDNFAVAGTLSAAGAAGAAGAARNGRNGGGGGGGAGGRIKLERPTACTTVTTSVAGGAAGAGGGGNARAGEAGVAGSSNCSNVQAAPVVASVVAAPATLAEGAGTIVTVTATDANGHALRYEFDCDADAATGSNGGFETVPVPATTNSVTCPAFTDNGTKVVRVRVTDWNGAAIVNASADAIVAAANTVAMGGATLGQASVTVTNVAPTAALTVASTVDEGASFTASATATDPSTADTSAGFTFNWAMGDGTTFTGAGRTSVTHTFTDNATRTVTVEVVDKDNGKGTASQVVTVNNRPPSATIGALPSSITQDPNANAGSGYFEAASTFTATATDPGAADVAAGFAYTFTFTPPGGGTPETATVARVAGNGSGAQVQRRFATAGVWTLAVTVTDKDGGTFTTAASQFTVNPRGAERGPDIVLTAAPGATIDEGGSVTLSAVLNDPNPGDNAAGFSLVWRCSVGAAPQAGAIAPGNTPRTASIVCPYPNSGSFTPSLTATDRTGASNAASLPVTVRNVAPIVVPGAAPTNVSEGGSATISATASDLSASDVAAGFTFTFDFGDGTAPVNVDALAAASSVHTYADSGTFTATITARDADGASSAPVTVAVVVANVAPTATLEAPATGVEGTSLAFTLTATDGSPADAAAGFTYSWDFGDGTTPETGSGAAFATRTHPFPQDGSFLVAVTATDQDGGAVTQSATVTITNVAPSVLLGGDLSVVRGEALVLSPTVSDPGANDVLTYAWDFGDTTTSAAVAPTKSYTALGEFTVRLTVTDDAGASDFDEIRVTVRNRLPVASAATVSPAEPRSFDDLTVAFTVTDEDADPTTTTRIAWFVDGSLVADLANLTRVPADRTRRGQGWYAEVTPNDGVADGALVRSNTVTIGNIAPVASELGLEPAAPLRVDTLVLTYTYSDADGDSEQGSTIAWFRNGTEQPTLANVSRVPGPLTKGDTWFARVTPNDGALAGASVDSSAVRVGNTAPVITRLDDVASAASGTTTPISWSIAATDADNDTLTYRCFLGEDVVGTGTTQSSAFAVGTYTIRCEVSDGTDTTVDSLTVAVGDVPPIVDAGADQTVDPGRPRVTAQGRDTLGRPLSYAWTVVRSAATVNLLNPAQATTEFFARKAGEYELKVTVSNGVNQATDTVVVTVRNVRPAADAGPLVRSGTEGVAFTLDGVGSSDPNGDTLTYLWERVSGPAVVNAGAADQVTFTATPDAAGELVMKLTVSDGALTASTQVTLRISPAQAGNTPPIARAGNDGTALVGETVPLDGSGSFDLDPGTTLTYDWQAVSGPATTIAAPAQARTTFSADAEGTYVFRLTVSDGNFEANDEVSFVVTRSVDGNRRPIARVTAAGLDPQTLELDAQTNQTINLDGATSSDPDGDALTYQWTQVTGPFVSLGSADQASVSFVPTAQGVVVVQLVVSDGRLSATPVQVTIRVSEGTNLPPNAVATGPTGKIVGELVTLDGTGSSDPEGATLTYAWTQASGPAVALSANDAASPTFTPSEAGTYVFRLVVSDGLFGSEAAEVSVVITKDDKPVAVAQGPARGMVGEPTVLDGSDSSDPEGATITFAWTRVSGPAASLDGADTAAPSFVPTEAGTYVFRLLVNDGRFESDPSEVTVIVDPIPALTGGCATTGLEYGLLPLAALFLRRRRR